MFSALVTDRWVPADLRDRRTHSGVTVVHDPERAASALRLDIAGGPRLLRIGPRLAQRAGLSDRAELAGDAAQAAIAALGWSEDETGLLFHLPGAAPGAPGRVARSAVRRLTATDRDGFAALLARVPGPEREEASVDLADWLVYGAFAGDVLVAAASACLEEDRFADIGVLTDPGHRGAGHATAVVAALTAAARAAGREPQYRCDAANPASAAVARAAGYRRFCSWSTYRPSSQPAG